MEVLLDRRLRDARRRGGEAAGRAWLRWAPRRAARRARRIVLDALGRTGFGTVTSVATHQPLVALTFDDGPDPICTPRILDVLAAHGAKATFFVVGEQAERHPEIVARTHREGHALGNHSHRHPNFTLVPSPRRLFRPPHLDQTLASRFDAWPPRPTSASTRPGDSSVTSPPSTSRAGRR